MVSTTGTGLLLGAVVLLLLVGVIFLLVRNMRMVSGTRKPPTFVPNGASMGSAGQGQRRVTLSGEALGHMEAHKKALAFHVREVAAITSRALGSIYASRPDGTLEFPGSIVFRGIVDSGGRIESIKVTQLDQNGRCVGVYEDPPGISRQCEPGD